MTRARGPWLTTREYLELRVIDNVQNEEGVGVADARVRKVIKRDAF